MPDIMMNTRYDDPVAQFTTVLQAIGGTVLSVEKLEDAAALTAAISLNNGIVVNGVAALGEVTLGQFSAATAVDIEQVHTVVLRGTIGVAENGAIWLPESAMGNRLLPFLCQHLVLVVYENEIVHTLHDAYATIRTGEEGYGVFIAGPSKTADIEQSLVLGAHGPLSLQVVLVKDGVL